jgi:hypothetical protein
MAKKKPTTYFPKDYPDFKIIKKFKKGRSPRTRLFITNDPDEWFIDVIEIKTKSGEVTDEEGWVIRKDLDDWTEWYKRLKWEEEKT